MNNHNDRIFDTVGFAAARGFDLITLIASMPVRSRLRIEV